MDKSPDAFRTISEVAEWLETPAHVLRFWESRFSQVKPVKRAGGRRYYRPSDMALLGGIKKLLHEDGITIRGVQKILREQGVKHVASLSQPLIGAAPEEVIDEAPIIEDAPLVESPSNVVPLQPSTTAPQTDEKESATENAPEEATEDMTNDDQMDLFPAPAEEDIPAAEPEPAPARRRKRRAQAEKTAASADAQPVEEAAVAPEAPAPAAAEPTPPAPRIPDLPDIDPEADFDLPVPLANLLRQEVVRQHLAQDHAPLLGQSLARLRDLQGRMHGSD